MIERNFKCYGCDSKIKVKSDKELNVISCPICGICMESEELLLSKQLNNICSVLGLKECE